MTKDSTTHGRLRNVRLADAFSSQLRRRQPTQRVVYQRQQLYPYRSAAEGARMAGRGGFEAIAPADADRLREQPEADRWDFTADGMEAVFGIPMDKAWLGIHRVLSDGTMYGSLGEYPLDMAVLGDHLLCRTAVDDFLYLKHPPEVAEIAEELRGLSRQEFEERLAALPNADEDMESFGERSTTGPESPESAGSRRSFPRVAARGGVGLRKAQAHASRTLAEAEKAQKEVDACARQGRSQSGAAARARRAWRHAEQAMDAWQPVGKPRNTPSSDVLPSFAHSALLTRPLARPATQPRFARERRRRLCIFRPQAFFANRFAGPA